MSATGLWAPLWCYLNADKWWPRNPARSTMKSIAGKHDVLYRKKHIRCFSNWRKNQSFESLCSKKKYRWSTSLLTPNISKLPISPINMEQNYQKYHVCCMRVPLTTFTLFLAFVVIAAIKIHNLWKFQLSGYNRCSLVMDRWTAKSWK